MILMDKPEITQEAVFRACISGIGDIPSRTRCEAIADDLLDGEVQYSEMAAHKRLYLAQAHARGGDHFRVILDATRKDLKALYSKQMVPATKLARNFYDKIKMSAKGNICPYCSLGAVETLDHFLPKGRYSPYSILPLNLIPSCRDCNTVKADEICTLDNATSHPYFEDREVMHDEWLRAEIIELDEVHAAYTVVPPSHWPIERSERIKNHFSALELSRRYGVQAATRLPFYADLISSMRKNQSSRAIASILASFVTAEVKAGGENSWQAALAKAVVRSNHFQESGYLQCVPRP